MQMTNEQAIVILRDTPIDIRSTREDDIHTLYAMAQNMAIEALSNNNNQTNSELKTTTDSVSATDVIYRQQAIDAVCDEIENDYTDLYHDGYCDGVYDSVDVLKALPSAHPLTETDLLELEHRFGEFVRFVVEDMLSGEEKRWEKKN